MTNTTDNKKKAEARPMSDNIKLSFNGKTNKINIEIDVKDFIERKEIPLSNSGQSYTVASSYGNKTFESKHLQGLVLGLNIYAGKKFYDQELESIRNKAQAVDVLAESKVKSAGLEKLLSLDEAKLNKLLAIAAALD